MKKLVYGFGLFVILNICCYQNVLAATDNLKLAVNVTTPTTTNKIVYISNGNPVTVPLSWIEKVLYAPSAEVNITVANALKGDIIIKVDIIEFSNPAGNMSISSAWLKYDQTSTFAHSVEAIPNGGTATGDTVVVDKTVLNTLCLVQQLPARTTTAKALNLFHFITNLRLPGYLMFTAILVDDVTAANPQVIGVDTLPIYFNDIDKTVRPIWLDLIQSD